MNNNINLRTVGCDAEFFLMNKKTKEVISAEPYIKGSKYDPFPFDENNPHFTTSLDNVLCEVTIPPATTAKQWIAYLNKSMAFVKSFIPNDLDLYVAPSANLDEKYLQTEHARAFGCEPDFNAYTRKQNIKPYSEDETLRSCGKNACHPMQ